LKPSRIALSLSESIPVERSTLDPVSLHSADASPRSCPSIDPDASERQMNVDLI
jgi:hypothetical protein